MKFLKGNVFYLSKRDSYSCKEVPKWLNGFDQVKGQMFSNYNNDARLSVCAKV